MTMNKNKINKTMLLSLIGLGFFGSNFALADSFSSVSKDVGGSVVLDRGYSNAVQETTNNFVDRASGAINEVASATASKTEVMKGLMSKKTPNAREQGLGQERISEEALAEIRESQKQANNARQQGIQVNVAHYKNTVGKSKKDRMLVKNWVLMLKDVGVSEERTRFEASRLPKEEFVEWANATYVGLKNSN